jgi:hypothetical protein
VPKTYPCTHFHRHSIEIFYRKLAKLTSSRKVVPVVTRSGALVRGVFPSIKTQDNTRFQSKNERNILRFLEVTSLVKKIVTHPAVLNLSGVESLFYTPDAVIEFQTSACLVEAKARHFLKDKKTRERLSMVTRQLNENQIGLVFVLDDDVEPSLDLEIEDLLYMRPAIGKKRKGLDMSLWDPLGREPKNSTLETRWQVAQVECDALIARLMRRDPDELLCA